MEKFTEKTWQETSRLLCSANDFPPGFRIVLFNRGRAVSGKRLVHSGGFGGYPRQFRVWQFIEEAIKNSVRSSAGHDLNYECTQLRDHRNKIIDSEMTVQEVREMPGLNGEYSEYFYDVQEAVDRIANELSEEISAYELDPIYGRDDGPLTLLKAAFQSLVDHFEDDDIAYVCDLYIGPTAERRQWRPERRRRGLRQVLRRR